jgi:hypothetical protein
MWVLGFWETLSQISKPLINICLIRKDKVLKERNIMNDSREEQALSRSKEKLKRDLETRIMRGVDEILDIAEVAIGDAQRYKPFRSKVLRAGNNAIRDLKADLENHYKVLFVPTAEDVIEIQSPSVRRA